ncbi:MAG: hypothetical protein ACQSGP_00900 [Frankia sp.]
MTSRQAGSWRRSGLIAGEEAEMTQLRIIAALRRAGISARRIRNQLHWLRATSTEPPSSLRFAIYGREIYVRHGDGSWEGDARPGQLVLIFEGDAALRPIDAQNWRNPAPGPAQDPGPPARSRRRAAPPPATTREAITRYLAAESRGPRAGAHSDRSSEPGRGG